MGRILSQAGKLFGSLFLYGGGTVSAGVLTGIATSHASGGILTLLSVVLVVFGLAPASLGGWLLLASSKIERQTLREKFFGLLRTHHGRLSLLEFAAATRLEPAIARRQLDAWAIEFSANFMVGEDGEVYYVFAAESPLLKQPQPLQNHMTRPSLQSIV